MNDLVSQMSRLEPTIIRTRGACGATQRRMDLLSDRWLKEHFKSGGHRPHSKRHPKHSRGNSNRPIADSMDATPGTVGSRRSRS